MDTIKEYLRSHFVDKEHIVGDEEDTGLKAGWKVIMSHRRKGYGMHICQG